MKSQQVSEPSRPSSPPILRLISLATLLLLLPCAVSAAQSPQDSSGMQSQSPAPPQSSSGAGQKDVQIVPPVSGRASATNNIDSAEAQVDAAPADPAHLPQTVPAGRPVIGLVLEGGGAMGLAHIGVLQWLEENHIPIDRLAGTSMGALVGAIYASGHTAEELHALATGETFDGMFTLEAPYSDVSYRRRQDRRELPQAVQFGLR